MPEGNPTPTAAIISAAQRAETVTDDRGRKIVIRKLSLFERLKLIEGLGAAADLGQYFNHAIMIASVVSIDGTAESPARSKEQIEALAGRLDTDGFDAVVDGYNKHFKKGESADPLK